MNELLEMYEALGISPGVYRYGETVLTELRERFAAIDQVAEYNQAKVLHAMQRNRVSAACFAATTGYGYDDVGRDNLERVYADVFHTEAALVRPQITCGTHALAVALGIVDAREDETLRAARQAASNYKYAKSWLALALPVAYCLLDAAGTFADNLVLEHLDEASANVAYELTFLFAGLCCLIYTGLIRREKPVARRAIPKYIGAAFETAGQFAYIFAIADESHLAMSAPIISSYCAVSVIWGRIFLKEKLSWKHYLAIGVTLAGIVIMGAFDM